MTCENCLMFTHCRYDLEGNGKPCGHFKDKLKIVRCKECKHWGGKYASNECSLITELAQPGYWLKTLPNDFCSSGERKES